MPKSTHKASLLPVKTTKRRWQMQVQGSSEGKVAG